MPRDRRTKSPGNSKHPMMTRSRSRDNPQNRVVFEVLVDRVEARTRRKNNKTTEKEKTAAIAPSTETSDGKREEVLSGTTKNTKLTKWKVMLRVPTPAGTNSPIRHTLSQRPSPHRSPKTPFAPRILEIPATPGLAGASETYVEDQNVEEHDENAPHQSPRRSSDPSILEIPATPGEARASRIHGVDRNVEEHNENATEHPDSEAPRAASEASNGAEIDFDIPVFGEDEPAADHQQSKEFEKTIIMPINRTVWNQIKSGLNEECESTEDLKESISVYNKKARNWEFNGLNYCLSRMLSSRMRDKFFRDFRDDVTRLALQYSSLSHLEPIPILKRNEVSTTRLKRRQIACILANAFFCTLPDDWGCAPINFSELFEAFDDEDVDKNQIIGQKLLCTMKYFSYIGADDSDDVVKFQRLKLTSDRKLSWELINKNFESIEVTKKRELLDQVSLKIIFTDDSIGGGVFNFSANAEEINFLEHPELLILRLCAEPLNNDEALFISGVKNYCECRGSGKSLRYVKRGERTGKEILVIRWGAFESPISSAKFITEVEKIDSALNSIPSSLFRRLKVIEVGLMGDEYHELQFLIMAMIARKYSLGMNFCSHENRVKHQNVCYLRTILLDSEVDVGSVYKAVLKYTELELKDNLGYWLASELLDDEAE